MPYKRHHRKQHRLSSYWLPTVAVEIMCSSEFPSSKQPIGAAIDSFHQQYEKAV